MLLGLWINRGAPTHNLWLQAVRSIIPFETFSAALKDKPFSSYQPWDSFPKYLGATASQRMSLALLDHAWKKGDEIIVSYDTCIMCCNNTACSW